jgi:nitric oxide reductase subunit C
MKMPSQRTWILSIGVVLFISYSGYLYTHLPRSYRSRAERVMHGKWLWQQYNCNACHQLYGLGGFLGPDLTNEYSLKGPQFMKAFIENGTNVMPAFGGKEEESAALIEFLRDVDGSGKSDPRTYTINMDGTISQ